jgi:hypothetical protein
VWIRDVPVLGGVDADGLLQGVLLSLLGAERDLLSDKAHVPQHLPALFLGAPERMPGLHIDPDLGGDGLDLQVDGPLRLSHRDRCQVLGIELSIAGNSVVDHRSVQA